MKFRKFFEFLPYLLGIWFPLDAIIIPEKDRWSAFVHFNNCGLEKFCCGFRKMSRARRDFTTEPSFLLRSCFARWFGRLCARVLSTYVRSTLNLPTFWRLQSNSQSWFRYGFYPFLNILIIFSFSGLDPRGLLHERSAWENRYLMKEHRRAGATFQGKVYNFLERPTGWKCVLYHITV